VADPNASGAVRVAADGDLIVVVCGFEVRIGLDVGELRRLAVALAVAADEREGKQPSTEALAILEPVRGTA